MQKTIEGKVEGKKIEEAGGKPDEIESAFQNMKIMSESPENKRQLAKELKDSFSELLELNSNMGLEIPSQFDKNEIITIRYKNGPDTIKLKKPQNIEVTVRQAKDKSKNIYNVKTLLLYADPKGNIDAGLPFEMKHTRSERVPDIEIVKRKAEGRWEAGAADNYVSSEEVRKMHEPKIEEINSMLGYYKGAVKERADDLIERLKQAA